MGHHNSQSVLAFAVAFVFALYCSLVPSFPLTPTPAKRNPHVPLITNIWTHPRTTLAGLLIAIVSIGGVLSQQGITLGHAGTGTVVTLVTALASALLGLLSRDPAKTSDQ